MATTISVTPGDIGKRINSTIMDLGVFTFDTNISNYIAGQSYTFTVNSAYRTTFTKADVKQGDYITNVDVGGLTTPYFVITAINGYTLTVKAMMTITDLTPPSWSDEHIVRPAGLLSYSITTDGTMSTITEKVNGVTVNTRTATSGQAITLGLTQAQWDAIRFGKYTDNNPNNVITAQGLSWENGTYTNIAVGQTLTKSSNSNSLRTTSPLTVEPSKEYTLKVSGAYLIATFETDENGVVTKSQSSASTQLTITTLSNTKRLYLLVFNSSISTPILPSAVDTARPLAFNNPYSRNSIEISMGSEKWTHTFDKRLATDADILSATKAVKDTNEVYLPSVKKQLADAINAKGGSVGANADWLTMIAGITGSSSGRKASGTITSSPSTYGFLNESGNTLNLSYVPFDFSVLPFIPKNVIFTRSDKTSIVISIWFKDDFYMSGNNHGNSMFSSNVLRIPYSNSVVNIAVMSSSQSYNWVAYE